MLLSHVVGVKGWRGWGTAAALSVITAWAIEGASAHTVRGLTFPANATAFVSSPSAGSDAPVALAWSGQDTGLRVICFNVANSSPALAARPDWPRVFGVGFELPGRPSGFTLVSPSNGAWELVEGAGLPLGAATVDLDFAIVARPGTLRGLPPGQTAVRGSGQRFCVSGPFPDTVNGAPTTIESVLNGVVVAFAGSEGSGAPVDFGVWVDPSRSIPLYP